MKHDDYEKGIDMREKRNDIHEEGYDRPVAKHYTSGLTHDMRAQARDSDGSPYKK